MEDAPNGNHEPSAEYKADDSGRPDLDSELKWPEADGTAVPWTAMEFQNEYVVCIIGPLFVCSCQCVLDIDNKAMDEFITKCESSSPDDWSKANMELT